MTQGLLFRGDYHNIRYFNHRLDATQSEVQRVNSFILKSKCLPQLTTRDCSFSAINSPKDFTKVGVIRVLPCCKHHVLLTHCT